MHASCCIVTEQLTTLSSALRCKQRRKVCALMRASLLLSMITALGGFCCCPGYSETETEAQCSVHSRTGVHSCHLAFQIAELRARTEADCWDVPAWEGLVRETVTAAAKQPPADAITNEINASELLLKQFPSAVE